MLGLDVVTLVPERHRQTVLTYLADVWNGKSEPVLGVMPRPDGSELETEIKGTMLDHRGKRFLVFAIRDVTERQQQARQTAALAQAAANVAASDSIDAVLDAISEFALVGTRALAAWVKLKDDDHVAGPFGAAGVPDEFREQLRSAGCAAAAHFQEALASRRVSVYADWRQQLERAPGSRAPWACPGRQAPSLRSCTGARPSGKLTAIYREGEIPYAAETSFLLALADQAATASANARLLAALNR